MEADGNDSAGSFDSAGYSCVDLYAIIENTAKPQRDRSSFVKSKVVAAKKEERVDFDDRRTRSAGMYDPPTHDEQNTRDSISAKLNRSRRSVGYTPPPSFGYTPPPSFANPVHKGVQPVAIPHTNKPKYLHSPAPPTQPLESSRELAVFPSTQPLKPSRELVVSTSTQPLEPSRELEVPNSTRGRAGECQDSSQERSRSLENKKRRVPCRSQRRNSMNNTYMPCDEALAVQMPTPCQSQYHKKFGRRGSQGSLRGDERNHSTPVLPSNNDPSQVKIIAPGQSQHLGFPRRGSQGSSRGDERNHSMPVLLPLKDPPQVHILTPVQSQHRSFPRRGSQGSSRGDERSHSVPVLLPSNGHPQNGYGEHAMAMDENARSGDYRNRTSEENPSMSSHESGARRRQPRRMASGTVFKSRYPRSRSPSTNEKDAHELSDKPRHRSQSPSAIRKPHQFDHDIVVRRVSDKSQRRGSQSPSAQRRGSDMSEPPRRDHQQNQSSSSPSVAPSRPSRTLSKSTLNRQLSNGRRDRSSAQSKGRRSRSQSPFVERRGSGKSDSPQRGCIIQTPCASSHNVPSPNSKQRACNKSSDSTSMLGRLRSQSPSVKQRASSYRSQSPATESRARRGVTRTKSYELSAR